MIEPSPGMSTDHRTSPSTRDAAQPQRRRALYTLHTTGTDRGRASHHMCRKLSNFTSGQCAAFDPREIPGTSNRQPCSGCPGGRVDFEDFDSIP
jgi:hypothetical protein